MSDLEQFEDLLLKSARNGDHKTMAEIIKADVDGRVNLNINCKGHSKYNLGWTPLHLSSYFGHKNCVEILFQCGAEVDVLNHSGDTPLHKAALTNREGIVLLLLEHGASVSIVNGEGLKPSDMARKAEVRKLISGAERAEERSREEKLLHSAREGDIIEIKKILQDSYAPNINCVDASGNTSLHCASYRNHINVAVILLQNGCDTSLKNYAGQTALELVQSQQMEQVLDVPSVRSFSKKVTRFEGPLLRKMRIVGWRMIWAVLERGVLTFFNSRADASSGVCRRDYKYMDSAKVIPSIGTDQGVFIIQYNDRTQHRLAALSDPMHSASVNRQKWVCALEDHMKFSTHYVQKGFSINSDDDDDDDVKSYKPLGCMQDVLGTAKAHQELLEQQIQEVMALISYLDDDDSTTRRTIHHVIKKFAGLNSTAREMTSSLNHCLSLFKQQEEVRELQLKEEREKVRVLEESLQVLATEHNELEESIASRLSSSSDGPSLYNTPANSLMSSQMPNRFYPTAQHHDDQFFDAFSQDDDGDYCTLRSIPSPCNSEGSTNTLVSCMSSLPLDPQSPESPRNSCNLDDLLSLNRLTHPTISNSITTTLSPTGSNVHGGSTAVVEGEGQTLPEFLSSNFASKSKYTKEDVVGAAASSCSVRSPSSSNSSDNSSPQTPLFKTSDLSDRNEERNSDDSDVTISCQHDDGFHVNKDNSSSFRIVSLSERFADFRHNWTRTGSPNTENESA